MLCKTKDMSSIPRIHMRWKEATNSANLSSDFHIYSAAYMCPLPAVIPNNFLKRQARGLI